MAQGEPGTITFNTQQVSGGGLGVQSALPNYGVQGGGVRALPPVQSAASWFDGGMAMPDSNLPEFLTQLAEPALKRREQQQVWDGFVAARGGMTLDEIDESQPWYSKVFGPSNYEIGAITYSTMTNTAEAERDLVSRMPELRKLNPQQLSNELNRVNQGLMTGNTYADAILQKNFMDRAGPIMDLYTKERVAWEQTELMNGRISVIVSAGGAYHQTMRGFARLGNTAPMEAGVVESQKQALRTMFDAFVPSSTQTDESAKAVTVTGMKQLALNGDWYSISALQKMGVLNHLAADDRLVLEDFLEKAEVRAKQQWEGTDENRELLTKVAVLAAAGIGGEPLLPFLDQANNRYRADTGIDRNYYDLSKETGLLTQSTTGHIRAQEAAQQKQWDIWMAQYKEGLKGDTAAAKRDQDIAAGKSSFNGGNLGTVLSLPGVNKDLVQTGFTAGFNEMLASNPQGAMKQLVMTQTAALPGVSDTLKAQFQQRAALATSGKNYTDALGNLLQQYVILRDTKKDNLNPATGQWEEDEGENGRFTADAYFGPDMTRKFEEFLSLRRTGATPDDAYGTVFGESSLNAVSMLRGESKQQTQALIDARKTTIAELGPTGMIPGWAGGDKMTDASADLLARILSTYVDSSGALVGPDSSNKMLAATSQARANGVEITGRYVIDNKRSAPIYTWKGITASGNGTTPNIAAGYINRTVERVARAAKLDPLHPTARLMRVQDGPNGEPTLQFVVYDGENGGFKFLNIPGSEIRKTADIIAAPTGPGFQPGETGEGFSLPPLL